jgi:hypothetical protein
LCGAKSPEGRRAVSGFLESNKSLGPGVRRKE